MKDKTHPIADGAATVASSSPTPNPGATPQPESIDPDEYFPELDDFEPVPRRSNRHDGWSVAIQREFIRVLSLTGQVSIAARAVGRNRTSAYRLRGSEGAAGFALAWDIAEDMGQQHVRDLAYQRAVIGEDRPIVRHGKIVGYRRVYDNALLKRWMQVAKPQVYNQQHRYPGAAVPAELQAAYDALGGVEVVNGLLRDLASDAALFDAWAASHMPKATKATG